MKNIIFTCLFFCSVLLRAQTNPDYFPIAVWLQSTADAKQYKDAGINLYIGLWNGLDLYQLDDLKKAGMKVMCGQNAYALTKLSDTTIVGWTQQDEPDNAQWNAVTKQYDSCINPAKIIAIYDSLKAKDPTRPVYLNLGMGVAYTIWGGRGPCEGKINMYPVSKNGYLKGCDIASFDIYPVNSSDGSITGNLWYVPKGIDSLRSWTDYKKPVWCWIETTRIDENSPRMPTAAEVKSEVWMALIHGAKGIGYFCHTFYPTLDAAALLHDVGMIAAVKAINMQIHSLAKVLNSDSSKVFASVSSSNSNIPVDYLCKTYQSEKYIFAVAMRKGNTTATFTVDSGNSVQVLGEDRVLPIVNGKFTDVFSSYGVHLYKVSSEFVVANNSVTNEPAHFYPNPLTHQSVIDFKVAECPCRMMIYDVSGNLIFEKNNLTDGHLMINKNELSVGMYIYKLTGKEGQTLIVNKLIVE